jgi:hypothetical protein
MKEQRRGISFGGHYANKQILLGKLNDIIEFDLKSRKLQAERDPLSNSLKKRRWV